MSDETAKMETTLKKVAVVAKDLSKGLFFSAAIAAPSAYFFAAKFASTTFFVWAALFINGCIATWEDAMPGGFDNLSGEIPKELRGAGRVRFWVISLLGTVGIGAVGLYLFSLGY